jgi:hypothetical protein
MPLKSRLIIWALVAYLLPIGIFIYDRAWSSEAFYWAVGVTLLAAIYEFINWRQTRKL